MHRKSARFAPFVSGASPSCDPQALTHPLPAAPDRTNQMSP
jgi:hypothetical protein